MSSSSACSRSGSSARISSRSRHDGERGYALIAVVGIIGVLAVIAVALTERARVGASVASDFLEETRDLYAVQAAVALAERTLAGEPDMGKDGQLRLELTWHERHVAILITDQARKIDVNRAPPHQLAAGFAAIGFSAEEAATLAARTIDWRDSDDRPRPHGAEAADYLAAGVLSAPRNDRLVSLDEVNTVLGMSPERAEKLREQFTVVQALNPIASTPTRALNAHGLDRQTLDVAQSDGLTRSADDAIGVRDLDIELRVHRNGEDTESVHFDVLRN